MNGPYSIILADPPWSYNNKQDRNPARGGVTYPVLDIEELAALPIHKLAAPDCSLFLWATMPMLDRVFTVIEGWGFHYTTTAFIWLKLNRKAGIIDMKDDKGLNAKVIQGGIYSGLGSWTNSNAEICLFAKRGHPKRIQKNVKSWIISPVRGHSQKPPEIYDRIVRLLGDLPRIELFARTYTDGWDATGLDLDGRDIREVLNDFDRDYASYRTFYGNTGIINTGTATNTEEECCWSSTEGNEALG